jgi:putative NADH-flavin reductase
MQQKITLIGSTGLIGSNFLEVINNEDYQSVTAITRSRISNLDEKDFIKQSVHDFSNLEKMRKDLKTDVLVCALETTIKKAGSKDEFMKIDRDLPL